MNFAKWGEPAKIYNKYKKSGIRFQKEKTMQKYTTIKKLGEGSFGNVEKAQNIQTSELVAIKKLKKKYGTWEECLQLSEVKALRKISHPNIIKLKEVVRVINDAFLIFEYIERDMLKLITSRKEAGKCLEDAEIRYITRQIVEALACTHKHGFFHRDLKPENILISENYTVKIIDFGIAKQIRSIPPFTQYISTRWYRAPQLLFRFPSYSAPVDIFALGCLVAEMYLMKPLFQGNSQMDQISKICSIIGSPNMQNWAEGFKHAAKKGINFPEYTEILLGNVINGCPKDGLDFISECIKWDPTKRMTANQLLSHPFISNLPQKPPQPSLSTTGTYCNSPSKQSKQFSSTNSGMNSSLSAQHKNSSSLKKAEQVIKLRKNHVSYEKDEQFDQLLNSFDNKIKSAKNVVGNEIDDGDW